MFTHHFRNELIFSILRTAENKKNFLAPLNTNEDSQTQLMLPSDQLSPQLQHDFALTATTTITTTTTTTTTSEKNPIAAAIEKRYRIVKDLSYQLN